MQMAASLVNPERVVVMGEMPCAESTTWIWKEKLLSRLPFLARVPLVNFGTYAVNTVKGKDRPLGKFPA